jgi:hypothetical protein
MDLLESIATNGLDETLNTIPAFGLYSDGIEKKA